MLDVFNSDAFSIIPLTDAINKLKYVPGRCGQLGLFSPSGIAATNIAVEEKNGTLVIIPPTARGAPGTTIDKSKRTLRTLGVPHFEINDAVMAEEVQGVRAWGTENALETVQGLVMERGLIHSQSAAATEEFSRIGAVKGIVTYGDGSTLDLFDVFEITQPAETDFDLDNAAPAAGALRKRCATVVRAIANTLEGVPFSSVHAFCGDAFFDDLLAHVEVRASYLQTSAAALLREGYVLPNGNKIFGAFEFGGVVWENYRGAVGATSYVNTDKCHIFPLGVPGFFRTYYAPADYNETVNTIGRRLYARQYEMPNGKGVNLDVQTNPLNICTRPNALFQGRRT